MTKKADFKQRVRVRMAKTGESYATARVQLLVEERPGQQWMADALHVSNGDATDLPGTGLAERILYWRDVLHEGPVPALSAAELRPLRAQFLATMAPLPRAERSSPLRSASIARMSKPSSCAPARSIGSRVQVRSCCSRQWPPDDITDRR